MAKEKKEKPEKNRTEKQLTSNKFVDLLAFLALAAAAILLVIGPLLQWILQHTGGQLIMQILQLLAQYCVLAAIAILAWRFVRGKKKGWKIAFFIFLIVYIAGTVLGVTVG